MNKLSILYRTCDKEVDNNFNQSRPNWFSKFVSFKSFYNSFGGKFDIYIIHDGYKNSELIQYISKFIIKDIIYLNNVGNKESLLYCYNLAEKLEFDYIFFAEDDYLYLPNSYEIMMEGLNLIKDNGFVTLYGHLNRYLAPKQTGDVTFGHDYILLSQNSFWRSEDSTTGSIAMTKILFNQVKNDLIKHNINDCAFYREQLLKYNRRVFSCLPSKSTHVNKFFASPLIDWEKYNNSIVL